MNYSYLRHIDKLSRSCVKNLGAKEEQKERTTFIVDVVVVLPQNKNVTVSFEQTETFTGFTSGSLRTSLRMTKLQRKQRASFHWMQEAFDERSCGDIFHVWQASLFPADTQIRDPKGLENLCERLLQQDTHVPRRRICALVRANIP